MSKSTAPAVQALVPNGPLASTLLELRGLITAWKAIAKLADDDEQQQRDPIDWRGVQELAERADVLLQEITEIARDQYVVRDTVAGGAR